MAHVKVNGITHSAFTRPKRKKLFNQIVNKPEHCLHYLLPTAREQSVTDRLRSANKLPSIFANTRLTDSKTLLFVIP